MNIDLLSTFDLLQKQLTNIDTIQCIVLVFGVSEVLLARSNNILLYPAGIIAVIFSAYSLFAVGLYAESGLNLYYLVMSVYGWWHWSGRKNRPAVKIDFTDRHEWIITAVIVFGGWLVLYYILSHFTPSTVPAWDA